MIRADVESQGCRLRGQQETASADGGLAGCHALLPAQPARLYSCSRRLYGPPLFSTLAVTVLWHRATTTTAAPDAGSSAEAHCPIFRGCHAPKWSSALVILKINAQLHA